MRRYILYPFYLFVIVGSFLALRTCVDRKAEKTKDIEVVREDEELLGTWGSKSASGLVMFRLRRNGDINYSITISPGNDTLKTNGRYQVLPSGGGRSATDYPRLVAVSDKGDTLFNYFIAYITPYGSTVTKTDKMILNAINMYDTAGFIFHRIKE